LTEVYKTGKVFCCIITTHTVLQYYLQKNKFDKRTLIIYTFSTITTKQTVSPVHVQVQIQYDKKVWRAQKTWYCAVLVKQR